MAKESTGDGIHTSVKTGERVVAMVNALLNANHKAKRTDAELFKLLCQHFPGRKGKFQSIGTYRSYYNQGLHGMGNVAPDSKGNARPSKPQLEQFGERPGENERPDAPGRGSEFLADIPAVAAARRERAKSAKKGKPKAKKGKGKPKAKPVAAKA